MRILLVDFDKNSQIQNLIPSSHVVTLEKNDGGKAWKLSGEKIFELIIINCITKPSHGLQTARAIKKRKKTASIPMYLVVNDSCQILDCGIPVTLIELPEIFIS